MNIRAELRLITKPIVHTDLRIVDNADAIICNLDVEKRPCGTYDETFTAADQNKPIVVYCPTGLGDIPDWMWGRIPHELFFDSWQAVMDYLDHIDKDPDEDINLLNRWKFFDWEPLTQRALQA